MYKIKLNQLIHTAKYLRFKQIIYRLYYIFYAILPQRVIDHSCNQRVWRKQWTSPGLFYPTLTPDGEITLLGESGFIKNPSDWHPQQRSKLWLYHLHYLNELNAINADTQFDLYQNFLRQWIQDNLPLTGVGWEPFPLSIRIVNLVKWYSRHSEKIPYAWIPNLAQQAEALYQKIEYHILGNHLLINGKALVFAGSFLEGERATRWLNKGLDILDQEVKEQFLPDGGHFELSPMYHASLLWDMCDLVNLAQVTGLQILMARKKYWLSVISRGMNWLGAMIHPDGQIPFFNDAAFSMAPEYSELAVYMQQLQNSLEHSDTDGLLKPTPFQKNNKIALNWLKTSGYCVIYLPDNGKAILDIANLGPDYQPGHAHADTLSFELSLLGQRLIVNSGTSQYGEETQRQYERSTAAHNTVCIDDENSSEVWAGFRVARRAYPQKMMVTQKIDNILVAASHNGYRRLAGRNIHHREWRFTCQNLFIKDTISGEYKNAVSRLYFHPHITIEYITDDSVKLLLPNEHAVFIKVRGFNELLLENTHWYPYFGQKINNQCLKIVFSGKELLTELLW